MEEKENGVAMESSQWETPSIEVVNVKSETRGGDNEGGDLLERMS